MHNSDTAGDRLERLLANTQFVEPPQDFTVRMMARLEREELEVPRLEQRVWSAVWLQWLGAGLGMALVGARLLGYLFSAWLALNVAG